MRTGRASEPGLATAKRDLDRRRVAVAIFFLLAGIYGLSAGGHTYSSDEEGMLATTRAMVQDGTAEIRVTADNDRVTPVARGRDGHTVGVSGLGQSLAGVPLYLVGTLVARTVSPHHVDLTERIFIGWTNAAVTALGAVFVFLIAGLLGARRRWAVALALVYGLCTMAWPHAKTFFSEPLTTTLALAATYAAFRAVAIGHWQLVAASGALAGSAVIARPTAGLFIPPLAVYLALRFPGRGRVIARALRTGAVFGAAVVPPFLLYLAGNWWRFGSPFELGPKNLYFDFPLGEGLYGFFLSPGKSLFLYAPAALVGLCASPLAPRSRRSEVGLLLVLGTVNALLFARYYQWHGDHAWGPRYLMMTLPFFVLPVAPLLERIGWRRALLVAGGLGFATATLGATMYFNQYFYIAERQIGTTHLPDGPSYWRSLHYEPYWSPLLGHARALPDVVRNSLDRLDGRARGLTPLPSTTNDRYGWYFFPPQLDSWAYWLMPSRGPRRLLALLPVFIGFIVFGSRGVVAALRRDAADFSSSSHFPGLVRAHNPASEASTLYHSIDAN